MRRFAEVPIQYVATVVLLVGLGVGIYALRGSQTSSPSPAATPVAAEFGPGEVAALVSLIVAINAWNAIGVSTRAWKPGSYEP